MRYLRLRVLEDSHRSENTLSATGMSRRCGTESAVLHDCTGPATDSRNQAMVIAAGRACRNWPPRVAINSPFQ
jgi:hypothetical protein